MRMRLFATVAVLLLAAILPGVVSAATPSAQGVPGESNLGFLLAGTALAWAGFFAYAFYIGQKNRELRRDIEELRQAQADRDSKET